jgi:Kef-type K+ transport system membrane component KefB
MFLALLLSLIISFIIKPISQFTKIPVIIFLIVIGVLLGENFLGILDKNGILSYYQYFQLQ